MKHLSSVRSLSEQIVLNSMPVCVHFFDDWSGAGNCGQSSLLELSVGCHTCSGDTSIAWPEMVTATSPCLLVTWTATKLGLGIFRSFREISKLLRYLENLGVVRNIHSFFGFSPVFSSLFFWNNTVQRFPDRKMYCITATIFQNGGG